MIRTVTGLIQAFKADLAHWDSEIKLWFRGESGSKPPLCPKISEYTASQENFLTQSFRRQAGAIGNVPSRLVTLTFGYSLLSIIASQPDYSIGQKVPSMRSTLP